MEKFSKVSAIAASLNVMNIDTDMIIPKQFLKTIKRTGLGENLFHEMRYDLLGNKIADFVLNREPFDKARILVAGDNFGCGSSREHAPWALMDFGITVVIAPSFADIFFNNCFKNGILPITLPVSDIRILMEYSQNNENPVLDVDLNKQEISVPGKNLFFKFAIDDFRKKCLLEGLDDIGLTLAKGQSIASYEAKRASDFPWLY